VNDVQKLRATLARRESGRGRRFAPKRRRQISTAGRRLRDAGKSWHEIGRELGLPGETVRRLCEQAAPGFAPAVEVVIDAVVRGLVVVPPTGFGRSCAAADEEPAWGGRPAGKLRTPASELVLGGHGVSH
jgi:hypothetical protein